MTTQKDRSDASSRLAQKLKESKARAKKEKEEKEKARAKSLKKGNGQSAAAVPAKEEKKSKKSKKAAPAKKAAPKKAAKASPEKSSAKKAAKKAAPAKKKAVSTAKEKGAAQKRRVQVKDKGPKVEKGLAKLVQSKDIDLDTGLTVLQFALVKLIEGAGDEGISISDIISRVWPQKKVEELRQEAKDSGTSSPDRLIRNAIRRPVEHGFIERADGKGLYRFLEWTQVPPGRGRK